MEEPDASPRLSAPTLDSNGDYPFRLEAGALVLDLARASNPYFLANLRELKLGASAPREEGKTLRFAVAGDVNEFVLTLHGENVTQLVVNKGELREGAHHWLWQLTVAETRALGMIPPSIQWTGTTIPYPRAARGGFDTALHAPLTDLHTHASAQVRAEDLFDIARLADAGEEPVAYPVELLKLLKVPPTEGQRTVVMSGASFPPLREEGLLCEQEGVSCDGVRIGELTEAQHAAIIRKMKVAPDKTILFSDFDREMYRYRNPLVRHPALTKVMLHKIAEDYAAQGIRYAELSTSSMGNPRWFRQMAEALAEIDAAGGPTLRFLVGLPRNVAPWETQAALEKVKYLARHPYITGVDLLGYESNKTSDFHWALAHMAQWAEASEGTDLDPTQGWNFKRDFTIRVHAGETTKNPENVKEAIRLAQRFGIRMRIAHTLTAKLDDEAHRWLAALRAAPNEDGLAADRMSFELCPDSNQVYRTRPLVHESPLKRRMKWADVFLGSDGAGVVATTNRQLAFSALAAGASLDDLARMRAHEEGFIARQRIRESRKRAAFETRYGANGLDAFLDGYRARIASLPRGEELPPSFAGKRPIFIGGASGSSWKEMSAAEHTKVRQLMQLLVRVCNPRSIYFVLGRVQDAGVSRVLDIAIGQHNRSHPQNKFDLLGRYAGAANEPTGEIAESISWVQPIAGGRDAVPGSMLKFLKRHEGMMICCDGGNFTAEMITGAGAEFRDIPHALLVPARPGPVADQAELMGEENKFRDVEEFVARILTPVGPTHFFRDAAAKSHVLLANFDAHAAQAEAVKAARNGEEKD